MPTSRGSPFHGCGLGEHRPHRETVHWIYQEVEMSTGSIIVLVVVAVVVAAAGTVLTGQLRHRRLRERFGPEYDRVVHTADDRRAAERVLKEREQRHAKFELRPL